MQEQLKARFASLLAKAQENKAVLIKVGGVLGGAILGAIAVTVVAAIQDRNSYPSNQDLMDDDESTDEE